MDGIKPTRTGRHDDHRRRARRGSRPGTTSPKGSAVPDPRRRRPHRRPLARIAGIPCGSTARLGTTRCPACAFPPRRAHWPTGREMGDYLEAYARRFDLPVRSGTRVDRVEPDDGRFMVSTADGASVAARQVIVATGPFREPNIPAFAGELDPSIRQMHSHEYRNPAQLSPAPSSWSACRIRAPTSRSRRPTRATDDPVRQGPRRAADQGHRHETGHARLARGRVRFGHVLRCARRWAGGCARGPEGRRSAPPDPPPRPGPGGCGAP